MDGPPTDLKNMAVWQEWVSKISIFKNIYLENGFIQWTLKQFLFIEMRRIDLLCEIYDKFVLQCLMFMNFVALFIA
jgi:hypothetical protein